MEVLCLTSSTGSLFIYNKTFLCLSPDFCYLRSVLLLLLCSVFLPVLTGSAALTVPAAALLLPSGQSLEAAQELDLPGPEVRLNAAVSALHHVAVALSSAQHSPGAQHPQPLVDVFTHLRREWNRQNKQSCRAILVLFGSDLTVL